MERKRKRREPKTCSGCGEEYSGRHLLRHTCSSNQTEDPSDDTRKVHAAPIVKSVTDAERSENRTLTSLEHDEDDIVMEEEDDIPTNDVCLSESSDNEEELCEIDIDSILDEEDSSQELDNTNLLIVSVLKVLLRWQSLFYVSDLALSYLLLLVKSLLYLVSAASEFSKDLYKKFPSNLYQLNKSISFKNDMFRKYAVCPKCYALYVLQSV